MAKWLRIDGKKFENSICALDEMMCSKCGYLIEPRIDRWEENGRKMMRYVHRSKCPKCGADMEDYGKNQHVPTNADRIRSMNDEELAGFLGRIIQSTMVGYAAIADKVNEKNAVLIHGWLEWLKQEFES